MTQTDQEKRDEILHAKLNLETSQIAWSELERFFASGIIFTVTETLDLVDVAVQIANDNTHLVSAWLEQGLLTRVTDEQAQAWAEYDTAVWTVVLKPWILVQGERRQPH